MFVYGGKQVQIHTCRMFVYGMAVYLQDACVPTGCLCTYRMPVCVQDVCTAVGCLYTCRMSVNL